MRPVQILNSPENRINSAFFHAAQALHLRRAEDEGISKGEVMECFFTSFVRNKQSEDGKNALISFTVPDHGIVFRASFKGTPKEVEYAALLALLEFVEINPQLFKNKTLEIYSDSFTLVNQVNKKMHCSKDLEPFRNMALLMQKKIPYSLNLIPLSDNPALQVIGVQ